MKKTDKKKIKIWTDIIAGLFVLIAIVFSIMFFSHTFGSIAVTNGNRTERITNISYSYLDTQEIKTCPVCNVRIGNSNYFNVYTGFYGRFQYEFTVDVGGKEIHPKIIIFKTNNWKHQTVKVHMNITQEKDVYNAEIILEHENGSYKETFEDIEKNPIEMNSGV